MTPAEQGIQAARREVGMDETREIWWELQTWDTALLLKMEQYTHHEGQWMIRLHLADRGVDTDGRWVGHSEADEIWTVIRTNSEAECRFYRDFDPEWL